MPSKKAAVGAFVAAVMLAGCGTSNDLGPASPEEIVAVTRAASATPRFQGGEKVRITVFNEPTLSGDYNIDPSGDISLPLAGTIRAVGLTQPQFEAALARRFRSEYLKNPKVTVTILEFRPIYVVGEVERQGELPFRSGLNALTAIALAGGQTYRANRDYVLIQHFGEVGMREYPQTSATLILPGDLLRVPERYF